MKNFNIISLVIIFFICSPVHGIDKKVFTEKEMKETLDNDYLDPVISFKYERGSYLIYDCQDKHWICSGSLEFKRCQDWKKQADKRNAKSYQCVAVKRYKNISSCVDAQYAQVNKNHDIRFCLSDATKKIEVNF